MPKLYRNIKDALLSGNVALPNAANTVNTNVVDLGGNQPYPTSEAFQVRVSTTQATGANSKNINTVLQGSNESNANFTNIAGLGAPLQVIAGNAANVPSSNIIVSLPAAFSQRYIRAQATGEANGGNSADGTLTVELVF